MIHRQDIEGLRRRYSEGTRIKLNQMNDPYYPVEPGTMGTVKYVDDAGTVHVVWDNGRALGLIPGEDSFSVVEYQETHGMITQEMG